MRMLVVTAHLGHAGRSDYPQGSRVLPKNRASRKNSLDFPTSFPLCGGGCVAVYNSLLSHPTRFTDEGDGQMRIAMTKPLFAWDVLEDSPSLRTIRKFLAAVPDAKLLASLRASRGREQRLCSPEESR